MKKESRLFLLLTSSMALSLYIIHGYTPSLPEISNTFHMGIGDVANTISLYLIGFGISPLIYAPCSDRFGRRPIVLFGIALTLLSSILATISWSFYVLLLARLIQGIGMGVVPGTMRCMAADISKTGSDLGRLIHKSGTIFALMPAIAPITGGYIQYQFGWRFNLFSIVIFTTIIAVIAHFYLPETITEKTKKIPHPKLVFKKYFTLLTCPRFILFPLFSLASFTGMVSYLTYSPYFYQNQLNLNPFENGLIGIVATLSIVVGHIINVYMLKRTTLITMLVVSGFWQLLSGIIMFFQIHYLPYNILTLAVPFFIYLLGDSGIRTNAYSHAMSISDVEKSTASAVFSTIQFAGSGIIISLLMHIHFGSPIPLSIIFCTIGAFIFLMNIMFCREQSSKSFSHL